MSLSLGIIQSCRVKNIPFLSEKAYTSIIDITGRQKGKEKNHMPPPTITWVKHVYMFMCFTQKGGCSTHAVLDFSDYVYLHVTTFPLLFYTFLHSDFF